MRLVWCRFEIVLYKLLDFICNKTQTPTGRCASVTKSAKNADDDKTTRHDYLLWSKCVRSVLLNHLLVWSKCSLLSNFRSFFLSPFDSFFFLSFSFLLLWLFLLLSLLSIYSLVSLFSLLLLFSLSWSVHRILMPYIYSLNLHSYGEGKWNSGKTM